MTDRVSSLTVVLDHDTRVDDVETIANAARMIRGVASVELGPVADFSATLVHARLRRSVAARVFNLIVGADELPE